MKEHIAVIVAVLAIVAALLYFDTDEKYLVYDCGMAEWHPDIPQSVKEECRRQIREHYEQQKSRMTI